MKQKMHSMYLDRTDLAGPVCRRLADKHHSLPLGTCMVPGSRRTLGTRPSPATASCASETSLTESSLPILHQIPEHDKC